MTESLHTVFVRVHNGPWMAFERYTQSESISWTGPQDHVQRTRVVASSTGLPTSSHRLRTL